MSKEDVIKYVKKSFTESGHQKFFNYLKELIKLERIIKVFPYERKGDVLGMPDNVWFKYFKSHDELVGQIKMLMNVLGFEKVEVLIDGVKVLFSFKQGDKKNGFE